MREKIVGTIFWGGIALLAFLALLGAGMMGNQLAEERVAAQMQPQEDDPAFDCRVHGNEACGVEVEGVWYVIQFENGQPVSVRTR